MTRSSAFVIAVSGTSGSGKSTLVRGLADSLGTVGGDAIAAVFFDDYAAMSDLPENDLAGWLARGGDPNDWRTDRPATDLRALREGESITTLDGATTIGPLDVVVLEEPFGRARAAMAPSIDLALHVDPPLQVALARRVRRDFVPMHGEVPVEQADRLRGYLAMYLEVGGTVYDLVDRLSRESSDLVLDGLRTAVAVQRSVDAEVLAQLRHVTGGPHVVERVLDESVRADHERRADHALDGLAVVLLLPERAVRLERRLVRIGEQSKRQVLVVAELGQFRHAVLADPGDRVPGAGERRQRILEVAGLLGASGGAGRRVGVEDEALAGGEQVTQADVFPVGVGQREVGGWVTGGEADAHTGIVTHPDPATAWSGATETTGIR